MNLIMKYWRLELNFVDLDKTILIANKSILIKN